MPTDLPGQTPATAPTPNLPGQGTIPAPAPVPDFWANRVAVIARVLDQISTMPEYQNDPKAAQLLLAWVRSMLAS